MVKYLWLLKLACAVGYIVCTALLSMHKPELCLSHHGDCSLEATLSVSSAFQLPVCEKHGEMCVSQHAYGSCAFLNTTSSVVSLDKLYKADSPHSETLLYALVIAALLLLLCVLFDGDRSLQLDAQSFSSRKEHFWMRLTMFAFAIALTAISSYMIDHPRTNTAASCVTGSEEECVAVGDCDLDAIGVGDAAYFKLLTATQLVSIVMFTAIFLIPLSESELAAMFNCPTALCTIRRRRRAVVPQLLPTPPAAVTAAVVAAVDTSAAECSICLELVKSIAEVPPDLGPHALPCGHMFHHACIEQWSRRFDAAGGQSHCPLCRTPL